MMNHGFPAPIGSAGGSQGVHLRQPRDDSPGELQAHRGDHDRPGNRRGLPMGCAPREFLTLRCSAVSKRAVMVVATPSHGCFTMENPRTGGSPGTSQKVPSITSCINSWRRHSLLLVDLSTKSMISTDGMMTWSHGKCGAGLESAMGFCGMWWNTD